jgi:hypothetical protein
MPTLLADLQIVPTPQSRLRAAHEEIAQALGCGAPRSSSSRKLTQRRQAELPRCAHQESAMRVSRPSLSSGSTPFFVGLGNDASTKPISRSRKVSPSTVSVHVGYIAPAREGR